MDGSFRLGYNTRRDVVAFSSGLRNKHPGEENVLTLSVRRSPKWDATLLARIRE